MTPGVILLVEDNPDDATLFTHLLERYSIANSVEIADTGASALAWFESMKTPPVLLVLDLSLPGIDGLVFLRYLNSNIETRNIAKLVLTGTLEERDRIRDGKINGEIVMLKPLTLPSLMEAVRLLKVCWFLEIEQPIKKDD